MMTQSGFMLPVSVLKTGISVLVVSSGLTGMICADVSGGTTTDAARLSPAGCEELSSAELQAAKNKKAAKLTIGFIVAFAAFIKNIMPVIMLLPSSFL
jgi:hypothetical protein